MVAILMTTHLKGPSWQEWMMLREGFFLGVFMGLFLPISLPVVAAEISAETRLQGPRLLSLGSSNTASFNLGPHDRFQDVQDLRPIVKFPLHDGYSIVNRTVIPYFIEKPDVMDSSGSAIGLGDTLSAFFLARPPSGGFVFDFGPAIGLPTATQDSLGSGKWLVGFSALALLTVEKKLAVGAFISNFWSVAGDSGRPDVNRMLLEPILRYQINNGWFVYSTPVVTANWEASGNERWTIPLGGGLGRTFRVGNQVVQAQGAVYRNVFKPTYGADWSFQAKFTLLFPERIPRVAARSVEAQR
jgi:hypothetical protein